MSHDSNTNVSDQPSGGHPFYMGQIDIFRDPSFSPYVKLVYTALTTYADSETRILWPAQATLAADVGLSIRTVGKALREMEDAGLVEVTHTQTSNRYRLRDLKVGGYVLGSGPLSTTRRPDKHEVLTGSAQGADKQDHTTRPLIQTISTSSDAVTANPQRTSSSGEMKIYIKDDYWTTDKGHMMQTLAAALIRTLEHAKLELRPEARDRIREMLKEHATENNHRRMLAYVRYLVSCEEQWSWFAYLPEAEAA